MRKILLFCILAASIAELSAQPLRDEIKANTRRSAGNCMAYPGPTQLYPAPPPEGKKPFYISHYGQLGSHFHKQSTYDIPYQMMAAADSAGKLTPLGRNVLERLVRIRQDAEERWGELTKLGARQHRKIISRMVTHFPEVFADGAPVDARSTTANHSVLAMENAMFQMARMKPKVKIHHNATERDMDYLNQQDKKLFALKMDSATQSRYAAFCQKCKNNNRLMLSLFNDTAYIEHNIDADKLGHHLFLLAGTIQNTETSYTTTLYDLFTDDEIYRNWKCDNAWWYITYGACPLNGGRQPYSQRNLLRNIIEQADNSIHFKKPGAHLRFGHEEVILPLVCLLELDNYGIATTDIETIDRRGWANYKINPMGANLQLVFYRSNPDDEDIYVKVMLNENDAILPLKSDHIPYYRWNDFRDYYLKKLNKQND